MMYFTFCRLARLDLSGFFSDAYNRPMSFDQLWAPWRIGYITGDKNPKSDQPARKLTWQPGADQSCFLCRAGAQCEPASQSEVDEENLVVLRSKVSIVLLNRYPYNNGHLLVAPNRHVATLDQL